MAPFSNSDFSVVSELNESLAASSPQPLCSSEPSGLCIGDLVDVLPAVLTPQVSIREAVQVMQAQTLSCVVVAEAGTILGLFTEQEVLDSVAAGLDATTTSIGLSLVPQVPVLRPGDSLAAAFQALRAADRRYLLVVDEQGQICGLVPRQRLYRAMVDGGSMKAGRRTRTEAIEPIGSSGGDGLLPVYWSEAAAIDHGEDDALPPTADRSLTILTNIHYQLLGLEGQNRLRVFSRCLKLLGVDQPGGRGSFV